MSILFKYLKNFLDNQLDNFFSAVGTHSGNFSEFRLRRWIFVAMDISRSGHYTYVVHSLRRWMTGEIQQYLLARVVASGWLVALVVSDFCFGALLWLFGHLGMSRRVYEDYVFNGPRRRLLLALNTYLVVLIFISALVLFC